ncbi:MAG: hypothetical protein K1X89_11980 [Myxococcaceae bacterium]|nr:hypothetical protein [Myxococcaceae bacterium]
MDHPERGAGALTPTRIALVASLSLNVVLGVLVAGFLRGAAPLPEVSRLNQQVRCGQGDAAACREHVEETRQRCDRGDAEGCVLLGIMLQVGKSLPQDLPGAVAQFQKACALKSGPGCWYLGTTAEYGRGAERNLEAARTAYQQSCGAKHENGCISLGDLLRRPGPLHDRDQALAAYDAACAIPYEGGCARAKELRAQPQQ